MENLLFVLIFASATAVALAVLYALFGDRRAMKKRLRGVGDYTAADEPAPVAAEAGPNLRERGLALSERTIRWVSLRMRNVWPNDYRELLRGRMARAGRSALPAAIDRLFAVKTLQALLGGTLMLLVALAFGWRLGFALVMVAGAAAGGFFLQDSRLDDAIKKRQRSMLRELPDVLDMLTISVTAGLGFDQALAKYVRSADSEMASEFERALKEVNAGASRKQALRAMAERIDSQEVSAFVAAVSQAEAFGTPIAQVLRAQAADLRLRRRQRAEEEAQKAPVKMTVPLMLIIMPATILILLGPALMSLAAVFG